MTLPTDDMENVRTCASKRPHSHSDASLYVFQRVDYPLNTGIGLYCRKFVQDMHVQSREELENRGKSMWRFRRIRHPWPALTAVAVALTFDHSATGGA